MPVAIAAKPWVWACAVPAFEARDERAEPLDVLVAVGSVCLGGLPHPSTLLDEIGDEHDAVEVELVGVEGQGREARGLAGRGGRGWEGGGIHGWRLYRWRCGNQADRRCGIGAVRRK